MHVLKCCWWLKGGVYRQSWWFGLFRHFLPSTSWKVLLTPLTSSQYSLSHCSFLLISLCPSHWPWNGSQCSTWNVVDKRERNKWITRTYRLSFSPPLTCLFAYTALSKSTHNQLQIAPFAWNFYDYVSAFIDFACHYSRVLLFYLACSFF